MNTALRRAYTAALLSALLAVGVSGQVEASDHRLVVSVDAVKSEPLFEQEHTFSCTGPGEVLVGRNYTDENRGWTSYMCATVLDNGKPITIGERTWYEDASELTDSAVFAGDRVLVGRALHVESQASEKVRYEWAQATTDDGSPVYVQLGRKWDEVNRNSHKFTCPENLLLAGRYTVFKDYGDNDEAYACGIPWATSKRLSGPAGTITLRQAESNIPCALNIPNHAAGVTEFPFSLQSKDGPCWDNETEALELNSVPSQTRILLTEDGTCTKEGKWWIEVKTIQKSTTIPYDRRVQLPEFFSHPPGTVVRPGLMLVASHRESGNPDVSKALSCVAVSTSAAPPPH